MKKKELQAIAQAAAKNFNTEEDLNEFRQMLTKITVEAALNAKLDDHLGFDKHEQSGSENNRVSHKTLFLYAQGMTTREIVRTFKEMYGADASPALISKVTDAVIEEVRAVERLQTGGGRPEENLPVRDRG
jgi:transposase-like protein